MKVANTKRLPRFAAVGISTAVICVAATANVLAAQPYFKVFGGDAMSGGWFADAKTGCPISSTSNFQDPWTNTGSGVVDQNGGIIAYANENASHQSTGGASVQYGGYALGTINGFYSGGALAATTPIAENYLSFSNSTNKSTWGGQWQGNVRQAHCIPDYFGSKKQLATQGTFGGINNTSSGQYWVDGTGSPYVIAGGIVGASKDITLFVSGNAYISANITYPDSSTYSVDQIPKFTLVAKGNIYISGSVTRLDGVYIAQPAQPSNPSDMTLDDGNIWTCHGGSTTAYGAAAIATNCASNLFVNGSLIAKQVNFLRTPGDVIGATITEGASANVAESINQPPETVIGGPMFYNLNPTGYTLDALISLPPVF